MTDSRAKITVETSYSREMNSLVLVEKEALPQDNSFFIQLLSITGGAVRLSVRIDDSQFSEQTVTRKEFTLLQDTLRNILDTPGKAGIINLGGNKIQLLHFENGEIGVGIGKGKYLLEPTDAILLREFCVKVM
jgi:hypothetical protein